MQYQVKNEIHACVKQKARLLYLLCGICVFVDLIMYYAAGLTLNTLFAGIGSLYVSLIALFSAAAAVAGKFLFSWIRTVIEKEIYESCLNRLEEITSGKEDSDSEELYGLFTDATHYEVKGVLKSHALLIMDVIFVTAVSLLDLSCGLLLGTALFLYDVLLHICARRNVTSAEIFRFHTALIPSLPAVGMIAFLLIRAMAQMHKGVLGLYGVIMILFIVMDILREHALQNERILSFRKELRSMEKIEEYLNEGREIQGFRSSEEKKNTGIVLYVTMGLSMLGVSAAFLLCLQEIRQILSYRTALSVNAVQILIPVCLIFAVFSFSLFMRYTGTADVSVLQKRTLTAVMTLLILIIALFTNPLLGGILASAAIALEILVPLVIRMRQEKTAEQTETADSYDHIFGPVSFLFLILIIAGGDLLYWNAMASFPDVLMIVVLYRNLCMYLVRKPFISRESEEIAEAYDEQ